MAGQSHSRSAGPTRFAPSPRPPAASFSEARTADALKGAYENLGSRLGREPGMTEVTFLFVAIAAGLLLVAGVLSAVVSPRLP